MKNEIREQTIVNDIDITDAEIIDTFCERPEILRMLKAFESVPKERKEEAYTMALRMLQAEYI